MKILVADDVKTNLAILTASLQDLGHEVFAVDSGEKAIDLFLLDRPDLIILDVVMEGMDGFDCARKIREIDSDDWIPIIFLSSSVDDKNIALGIDAGGDDYLAKPFSQITLAAKIKAMQRIADMRKKLLTMTQQLGILSSTDSLTGLYNRYQFERSIKERIAYADRKNEMLALLFIDLDYFKPVNDKLGHHIGDLLLIAVAKCLKKNLSEYDFVARMGGDEFAIILSNIENKAEAGKAAEKILYLLTKLFDIEGNKIQIGASIGISFYPSTIRSYENLVNNADAAMYKVKELGRNNYRFYSGESENKNEPA